MHLSISDIKDYLECRRAWNWRSSHRMHLAPRTTAPALWLGTGVHHALEHYYRDGVLPTECFAAWALQAQTLPDAPDPAIVADLARLGMAMLTGYADLYGTRAPHDADGTTWLCTEQEYELALPGTTDGSLVGRLDGIVEDSVGRIWVAETKTTRAWPAHDEYARNWQRLAYAWATQRLTRAGVFTGIGIPKTRQVCGVMYNGLRKQHPGHRSTSDLYHREWITHSPRELAVVESDLAAIHNTMQAPDLAVYPTFTPACRWCAFSQPCSDIQAGNDPSASLATGYRVRPARHAPVAAGGPAAGLPDGGTPCP